MDSTSQICSSATALWNVFLSFRGIDTRLSFTSHLYDALHRNGIRTFMDDPELHRGEVISSSLVAAIQSSKIFVVVISENYASSSWCLDELVEILKRFKELKRTVIPVFYKIDPSVVRHQTQSLKPAFERHENVRFEVELDRVNSWRDALKEVANFSGYHVNQTRSEADIINEVVDAVLRVINPMSLQVAKYPVGIDIRVEALTQLLGTDTEGVRWIGIYGMGGVGKTTLAKAVYNQNFQSFEGSSFLANVREISGQPNGLNGLQEQLLANVLKAKRSPINSIDEGIELLRERISSKKVLVVVDDLNDQKQLDSLIVGPFASGSVIILTTRKEDLLDRVGVEAKYRYMLNELGDAESLQLFNRHAFGNKIPSQTFMDLSKAILTHARGLPLALEIFGSNLCNQSEAEWKRFIGQLPEVVDPDILKKLMVSFDSLIDPALKEMFLDIACFFVSVQREDLVFVLGSCYRDVDPSLDRLKSRCLITFDEYNYVSMHDLLREMGWEIARQNFPKDEPEKHSRLSCWEDICDVLENNKGTEAIKGMVHRYLLLTRVNEYNRVTFDTESFKRMPKLRFLAFDNVNLMGSFKETFKDLRWLQWSHCPLTSLPSDFCPKKLVILELRYSKIERWKLTKDLKNLKTLDLAKSDELLASPDFSRLPFLEIINLSWCIKLEKVDTTIGSLVHLVSLDMKHCTSLRSLPDSVCNLRALENLDLGDCYLLEVLPKEIGNIESLIQLNMERLQTITKLPDSFARLSKLVKMRLVGNKNLETLPDIYNMNSLEILDITGCEKLEQLLPYGICQLSNVQPLPNLREVQAAGCSSMLRLPDISHLKHLKIVNFRGCCSLEEFQGLEEIISIRELYLGGCTSITRLPNLSNFIHLEILDLRYCSILKEIEGLEELISITRLYLEGCTFKRLPPLAKLKQLERLCLTDCCSLIKIEGLEELTSVKYLDLKGCDSSMLANILTQSFFQIYSEFGNKIEFLLEKQATPNWISHSSLGCLEVRTNVSHKFLGTRFSCLSWGL